MKLRSILFLCLSYAHLVAFADNAPLPEPLGQLRETIDRKVAAYPAGGPVMIVAFGDSVTMGATVSGVLDPQHVYHNQLKQMLEKKYPRGVFSLINSGIGGDTARKAITRVARDVVTYKPHLTIVGFALNDVSTDPSKLADYKESLRQIVRTIREKTTSDIVLLTPNFMLARDNSRVAPYQRKLIPSMIKLQNEGHLARYAQAVRDVAVAENVPVADVYAEWEKQSGLGLDTTDWLANGLNHPDAHGHEIVATLIFNLIAR